MDGILFILLSREVSEMEHVRQKPRRVLLWILIVALVLVAAGAGVFLLREWLPNGFDADPYKNPSSGSAASPSSQEATLRDNPIDFAAIRADNEDVCGWITVPDTQIDYPILQSSRDNDDFYLDHNLKGNYDINGSIYIQRINSYDFSDPNTVIYGHNMRNGSMFQNLHHFRDHEFFLSHDTFYIYTPHHILTYRIFAAYRYDNRLILNSFDFSDKEEYQRYLDACLNPASMIRDVREGVSVTTDDRIVTLSTCINDARYRYLVQGVLIDDEETN